MGGTHFVYLLTAGGRFGGFRVGVLWTLAHLPGMALFFFLWISPGGGVAGPCSFCGSVLRTCRTPRVADAGVFLGRIVTDVRPSPLCSGLHWRPLSPLSNIYSTKKGSDKLVWPGRTLRAAGSCARSGVHSDKEESKPPGGIAAAEAPPAPVPRRKGSQQTDS